MLCRAVSSWMGSSPVIGMKSYFSFPDIPESVSSRLQPSISQSIPVGKLQDWMPKYQTQPISLLLLAKTQILLCMFCLSISRIWTSLCTKALEVENYLIPFTLMNDSLPTKCVFLSTNVTLNGMQMN